MAVDVALGEGLVEVVALSPAQDDKVTVTANVARESEPVKRLKNFDLMSTLLNFDKRN